MAKYVFLNIPTWGHVNPTLAVVQELVKRGHDVSYYLTEEFRETVEATGAVFCPYESKMPQMMMMMMSGDFANRTGDSPMNDNGPQRILFADNEFVLPQVIDRIRAEKPTAIIYDFMCSWAPAVV